MAVTITRRALTGSTDGAPIGISLTMANAAMVTVHTGPAGTSTFEGFGAATFKYTLCLIIIRVV